MSRGTVVAGSLVLVLALFAPVAGAQMSSDELHHARVPDGASPSVFRGGDVSGLSLLTSLRPGASRFPRADSSVPPAVKFRLEEAYVLATSTLRKQPTCSSLFASLGLNGEDALAGTRYLGGGEIGACLRQAPAFTCVRCPQTTLCPVFARLGTSAAATVLIHEALHFAGLKERPAYPGEMSAPEITTMVTRSCRL